LRKGGQKFFPAPAAWSWFGILSGMQLITGTYTETLPHVAGKADGILSVEFDPETGSFGADVRTLARMRNPSYLTVSPSGENVYAVSETTEFEGEPGGGVAAFARDAATGDLTRLNTMPTRGNEPCFVTLDRGGTFVLTANYGGGSASVYPVSDAAGGGRLGEMAGHVQQHGSGPDPERQEAAHTHMTGIDPVTGDVLAIDLGSDTIFRYALDPAGRFVSGTSIKAEPGAGPRHLAFHPGGRYAFVTNELGGTVTILRRTGGSGSAGGFESAGDIPAVPDWVEVESQPAAVRVSASGRHVLVSNRGYDSITVFRFDEAAQRLSLVSNTRAEGTCPRDFILTPDGAKIIVAAQDSDVIASYAFDDEAGSLRLLHTVAAATPVCLALA
jgi:6-phosphogluconolactonase